MVVAAFAAGAIAAWMPPAQAGTQGGLYSFEQILMRPHPFANVPSGFDTPPVAAVPAMPSGHGMSTQTLLPQPVVTSPPPPPAPSTFQTQPAAQPVQTQAQTAPPPPRTQPASPPPP